MGLQPLLQPVGAVTHVVEADDGRRALERMDLPKDRRDDRVVVAGALQCEGELAERGQAPLGLLREQDTEAVQVEGAHPAPCIDWLGRRSWLGRLAPPSNASMSRRTANR